MKICHNSRTAVLIRTKLHQLTYLDKPHILYPNNRGAPTAGSPASAGKSKKLEKFQSPHFWTRESALAREPTVSASRDRRQWTRGEELTEQLVASSAEGPAVRPSGAEPFFSAGRMCSRRVEQRGKHILPAAENGSAPDGRTAGPSALEATSCSVSSSPRVRWCRSRLAAGLRSSAMADSRVQTCGL